MDKKGLIKTLEAVISILIIMTAVFIVSIRDFPSNEVDYSEKARDILKEISKDSIFRAEIVNYELNNNNLVISTEMDTVVDGKIPDFLDYELKICPSEDICGMEILISGKDIFSAERIISSTFDTYPPESFSIPQNSVRKIKIFIWEK